MPRVPAVFSGDNAADFSSAQGWETTATMGGPWSLWTFAVSIGTLRRARRANLIPRPASRPVAHAYQ